jgi:DNA-binding IscR family transcriptional regulator
MEIPRKNLLPVLQGLENVGFVTAADENSGCTLAKSPNEISLLEMIQAAEGSRQESGEETEKENSRVRKLHDNIDSSLCEALGCVTLETIVEKA